MAENSQRGDNADERFSSLALGDSNLSSHDGVAQSTRTNWPLPRELRDQIHQYLLDGQYVQRPFIPSDSRPDDWVPSMSTMAHRYDFHTNILAVNKTIGAEAAELLYTRNMFVVVSTQTPGVEMSLKAADVPVISKKHDLVARMKNHVMRVHFAWRTPPMEHYALEEDVPLNITDRQDPKLAAFLMVAQDLESLSRALGCDLHYATGKRVYVGTMAMGGTAMLTPWTSTFMCTANTKFVLRETEHRALTTDDEKLLLEPFMTMIGAVQKVSIKGANNDLATKLKRAMCPTLIWPSALVWSLVDTLERIKSIADTMALNDDLEGARHRYSSLIQYTDSAVGNTFLVGMLKHDIGVGRTAQQLVRLYVNCFLSRKFLRIRLGLPPLLEPTTGTSALRQHLSKFDSAVEQTLDHLDAIEHLPWGTYTQQVNHAIGFLAWVNSGEVENERISHDYLVAKTFVDGDFARRGVNLDAKKLSPCVYPVMTFDFQLRGNPSTRPATMVGWQDRAHLKRLNAAEKRDILANEVKNGYEGTDFDELLSRCK